jgi:hypothetical protein
MPSSTPATRLVLVSGSGRSGTSSLAGTLKRLGLHIPQPEVAISETNPRGFYEPRWVIHFHRRLFKQLVMHDIDSRPTARTQIDALLADGAAEDELRAWLGTQLDEPQLVIKDPLAFWFADMWSSVCADLDVDLRWLTSVRHPAEVVGSRELAYQQKKSTDERLVKETSNVAGWVRSVLLTEKAGRGTRRSFVRYTDLLADWRRALQPVVAQLELDVNTDLTSELPHAVDDFLDSSMRKSQLGWDDVTVPLPLREMAEEVWQLLGTLIDDPKHQATMDRFDRIHEEYDQMYADAAAITLDQRRAEATEARREVAAKKQAEIVRLRRRLQRNRARVAELTAQLEQSARDEPGQPDQPDQPDQNRLGQRLRRRLTGG